MHKRKDEFYESIKDLKTKKEFEEEINNRFLECNKLFDKDTIALLIIDELGRNKQVFSKISELKLDSEYTVIGKITNIYEPKSFKRKNGTSGKVINLDISDDTGSCRLVLWNKDVEQIKNKNITIGTTVRIINGYTKKGFNGLELNVGRWGLFEVLSNDQLIFNKKQTDTTDGIEGILSQREPTKPFFKDDGEFGFVTKIKIKNVDKETTITVWDSKVKDIQRFKIGEYLIIKNISKKQNNGNEEIHVDRNSIIQRG